MKEIEKAKKPKEVPTEICTSNIHQDLKNKYKLLDVLKKLQEKYKTVIKDFDVKQKGKVEVTYNKVSSEDGKG